MKKHTYGSTYGLYGDFFLRSEVRKRPSPQGTTRPSLDDYDTDPASVGRSGQPLAGEDEMTDVEYDALAPQDAHGDPMLTDEETSEEDFEAWLATMTPEQMLAMAKLGREEATARFQAWLRETDTPE